MIIIEKILLNPWVVSIGTLIIVDIFVGKNILYLIFGIMLRGISFIQFFLGYKVSIGLVLGVAFIFGFAVILLMKKFSSKATKNCVRYFDYTEDTFQGVLYRWNYNYVNEKVKIGNIVAYCPACKCRIVHDECVNCNSSFLIDKKDRWQREAMIRYGIETKYQINEFDQLGK